MPSAKSHLSIICCLLFVIEVNALQNRPRTDQRALDLHRLVRHRNDITRKLHAIDELLDKAMNESDHDTVEIVLFRLENILPEIAILGRRIDNSILDDDRKAQEYFTQHELGRNATCLHIMADDFNGYLNVMWNGVKWRTLTCIRVSQLEIQTAKMKRAEAVENLKAIETALQLAIDKNNTVNVDINLAQLEDLWPKIATMSQSIFKWDSSLLEINHQKQLREDVARLRFKAKARRCLSPEETYYEALDKCVRIGEDAFCPEGQQFFDSWENTAFCDCKHEGEYVGTIYSNTTGQCYIQNIQGPCEDGEWWILDGKWPTCQPVPEGCPADGNHVFYSLDKEPPSCWELNDRGPCKSGILFRKDFSLLCGTPTLFAAVGNRAPTRTAPCPSGSFRNQRGRCREAF